MQGAAFFSRPCSFGESSPSTMRRDTSVATQKNEHSRADAQMISPSTDSKPPPSAYFLCRRRRAKGGNARQPPVTQTWRAVSSPQPSWPAPLSHRKSRWRRAPASAANFVDNETRNTSGARGPGAPAARSGRLPGRLGAAPRRPPVRRPHNQKSLPPKKSQTARGRSGSRQATPRGHTATPPTHTNNLPRRHSKTQMPIADRPRRGSRAAPPVPLREHLAQA